MAQNRLSQVTKVQSSALTPTAPNQLLWGINVAAPGAGWIMVFEGAEPSAGVVKPRRVFAVPASGHLQLEFIRPLVFGTQGMSICFSSTLASAGNFSYTPSATAFISAEVE